jgi:hypothetical protein
MGLPRDPPGTRSGRVTRNNPNGLTHPNDEKPDANQGEATALDGNPFPAAVAAVFTHAAPAASVGDALGLQAQMASHLPGGGEQELTTSAGAVAPAEAAAGDTQGAPAAPAEALSLHSLASAHLPSGEQEVATLTGTPLLNDGGGAPINPACATLEPGTPQQDGKSLITTPTRGIGRSIPTSKFPH